MPNVNDFLKKVVDLFFCFFNKNLSFRAHVRHIGPWIVQFKNSRGDIFFWGGVHYICHNIDFILVLWSEKV